MCIAISWWSSRKAGRETHESSHLSNSFRRSCSGKAVAGVRQQFGERQYSGFKQDHQGFRGLFARANSVAMGSPSNGIVSTISTRPAGPSERVFAEAHGVRTTFEPGRIRITGNPLDVAIQTDGFFEVKTPEGARYTRNGIFPLDSQRRLVTNLGHPVMGTKGEIKVPPGNIQINTEGAIQVDGNTIGNIKVVEF